MKRRIMKPAFPIWTAAAFFLFLTGVARGQGTAETAKKAEAKALVAVAEDHDVEEASRAAEETPAPAMTELDRLKMEWEAVREQQVQMIREKEDQLEKLKEEIFAKMKTQGGPAVSGGSAEFEAQKAAFQAERQKLFSEISRQKESLRQFQLSLDERAKMLELERDRFEQEKKAAAR